MGFVARIRRIKDLAFDGELANLWGEETNEKPCGQKEG
jgi:hypothetical protein